MTDPTADAAKRLPEGLTEADRPIFEVVTRYLRDVINDVTFLEDRAVELIQLIRANTRPQPALPVLAFVVEQLEEIRKLYMTPEGPRLGSASVDMAIVDLLRALAKLAPPAVLTPIGVAEPTGSIATINAPPEGEPDFKSDASQFHDITLHIPMPKE